MKMTVFWNVAIALIMEAVSTSEASVNFYQTTRSNIPEDSNLHTRHRENLKSHLGSKPAGIRKDMSRVLDLLRLFLIRLPLALASYGYCVWQELILKDPGF
jgi:hypothetical protein